MFSTLNFNLLLASVLVVLSCSGDAQAAPSKRSAVASMPIRSIHGARDPDVHPHVFLQQHINRSNRRLARMTGRQEPSGHEARAALQRRVDGVHQGFALGNHQFGKRYVVLDEKVSNKASTGGRFKANNKQNGQQGAAAGSNNAGAAAASGSNSAGVSSIDIQAAQAGGLTNANPPTANQSIGLDIEANDVGYIGSVQIGTPPRNFLMLMDSGSADFWVGSEQCASTGGGGCGNHTFLGSKSSSTFKATQQNFAVTYGTGNVAGTVITDDVNLAGLPLKAHTFGVATSESVDFSADTVPFDGLIGLAQSTLSQEKVLTPPESLASAGTIQQAIVAYKIPRLADQKNDGEVSFGGVDSTKFDANTLVNIPNVNKQGFFEAPIVPTVNGKSVGLDNGRTAIMDTGTTLIVAPAADAAAVHQAINGAKSDGQGGFTVPCTMTDVVTMQIGGQNFDIDPRDIAFLPVDATNPAGDCVSGISSGNIGGAQEWLVGDVFLKNAYFVTNVNTNTLSLAKLK